MTVTQTEFREAMLDAARDVPLGLIDQTGAAAGKRFSVYRNNVAVSLTEALETGFPAILKLLGEQNFKAIAGVYLRQSPPQSPLMMHYGQDFPDFLRSFPPLQHLGYLGDVAEIETAMRRSYHAADSKTVAADALGKIAPDRLSDVTMTLAPSLQIIRSPWPIFDIWAFNTREGAPKPRAIAQDVAILRPEFDPEPHALLAGDARFLTALSKGKTLGEAAELAESDAPEFDLGAVLQLMLLRGLVTGISLED